MILSARGTAEGSSLLGMPSSKEERARQRAGETRVMMKRSAFRRPPRPDERATGIAGQEIDGGRFPGCNGGDVVSSCLLGRRIEVVQSFPAYALLESPPHAARAAQRILVERQRDSKVRSEFTPRACRLRSASSRQATNHTCHAMPCVRAARSGGALCGLPYLHWSTLGHLSCPDLPHTKSAQGEALP